MKGERRSKGEGQGGERQSVGDRRLKREKEKRADESDLSVRRK